MPPIVVAKRLAERARLQAAHVDAHRSILGWPVRADPVDAPGIHGPAIDARVTGVQLFEAGAVVEVGARLEARVRRTTEGQGGS